MKGPIGIPSHGRFVNGPGHDLHNMILGRIDFVACNRMIAGLVMRTTKGFAELDSSDRSAVAKKSTYPFVPVAMVADTTRHSRRRPIIRLQERGKNPD